MSLINQLKQILRVVLGFGFFFVLPQFMFKQLYITGFLVYLCSMHACICKWDKLQPCLLAFWS